MHKHLLLWTHTHTHTRCLFFFYSIWVNTVNLCAARLLALHIFSGSERKTVSPTTGGSFARAQAPGFAYKYPPDFFPTLLQSGLLSVDVCVTIIFHFCLFLQFTQNSNLQWNTALAFRLMSLAELCLSEHPSLLLQSLINPMNYPMHPPFFSPLH